MTNDSRLTEEKEKEFSLRTLEALDRDDYDELDRINEEYERLKQSARTVSAAEAVGDSSGDYNEDDDVYTPEPVKGPAFVDDDDEEDYDNELEKETNPLAGLTLSNNTNDTEDTPEPQKEPQPATQTAAAEPTPEPETNTAEPKEQEDPETGPVKADDSVLPRTKAEPEKYYEEDDDDDVKIGPFQRLIAWMNDDETGTRKYIVIGGTLLSTALLILLGIFLVSLVPKDTEPAPQEPVTAQTQENEGASPPPAASLPGALAPVNVEARCGNEDADPNAMFTPDETVAWICQRAHGIDGAVVNIDLGNTSTISSVSIVPGFNYIAPRGEDEWKRHRVVTKVQWQFDDADRTQLTQDIPPTRTPASIDVPNVPARHVTMTILQTAPSDPGAPQPQPGAPDDTFAVSNVTITGTGS